MSFEPVDWDALEDAAAWDEWAARHEARVSEKAAQLEAAREAALAVDRKRTTKRVRATLDVTFHGDYIPLDEIPSRLDAWIDAGLQDRDDCRSWSVSVLSMTCETGDPDGYDS